MSTSNLFKVFGVNQIGQPDRVCIPLSVSSLVASENQVCIASWIKCEQDSIGPALMLNAQLFHIGISRALQGIDLWPTECRTQLRQCLDHIMDAAALLVSQRIVPFLELIADLDLPSRRLIIPLKRYSVKGIIAGIGL